MSARMGTRQARLLAAAVAMVMAVSLVFVPPPQAASGSPAELEFACPEPLPTMSFDDVSSTEVHGKAIQCLLAWEITQGWSSTSYAPLRAVTREQMATFLARLIRASGVTLDAPAQPQFDDVSGVHADNIEALAAAGVARGTSETSFSPSGAVDRAQMATFIVRALEHLGVSLEPADPVFEDVSGGVHAPAIGALANAGVVQGRSASSYDPSGSVTRAQMGSFLMRTADLLVERGITVPPYLDPSPDPDPDPVSYTLSTSVVGEGVVTRSPQAESYVEGSEVELSATPADGWEFAGWSGAVDGDVTPVTVVVDGDLAVTATFSEVATDPGPGPDPDPEPDPEPGSFVSDDFSNGLDTSLWSIVDPVGDGQWGVTGTGDDARLDLSVPAGTSHDPWHENLSLRAMQDVVDEDIEIEARFDSVPVERWQMQGLLFQEDDDNWVRFEFHHDGSDLTVYAASTRDAWSLDRVRARIETTSSSLWLRVRSHGDAWTVSWSPNGSDFTTMGTFTRALDVSAVGPFVANHQEQAGASPTFTARVAEVSVVPPEQPVDGEGPEIDLWYGSEQTAGHVGKPTRWVNVLGRITDPEGVAAAWFRVNDGPERSLSLGPDKRRLQYLGDFNVEVARDELDPGSNTITVVAESQDGRRSSKDVSVERITNVTAPLPYALDFSQTDHVPDVVEVADGLWRVEGDALRTVDVGYDRLLVVGEQSWTEYEVSTEVTVHGLGDEWGTPESGDPLVGLLLRWPGQTNLDGEQPSAGFFPIGAFAWHAFGEGGNRYQLIGMDPNWQPQRTEEADMLFDTTYVFKAQVENRTDGTRYRFKFWEKGTPEPTDWRLSFTYDGGASEGSVGLVAHHVDATFAETTISPLP